MERKLRRQKAIKILIELTRKLMGAGVILELEMGCNIIKVRNLFWRFFKKKKKLTGFTDSLNVKEEQKYFQILWLVTCQGHQM